MVYERASGYATNPMVSPLIEHMKENLRQQILDRAEQQRQDEPPRESWRLNFLRKR